jgi:hypothetical protein
MRNLTQLYKLHTTFTNVVKSLHNFLKTYTTCSKILHNSTPFYKFIHNATILYTNKIQDFANSFNNYYKTVQHCTQLYTTLQHSTQLYHTLHHLYISTKPLNNSTTLYKTSQLSTASSRNSSDLYKALLNYTHVYNEETIQHYTQLYKIVQAIHNFTNIYNTLHNFTNTIYTTLYTS